MRRLTFHLIPHTHWDREWYLSRAAFTVRLGAALDRVVELLERDRALRFHLDGQAILIEDYFAVRPAARPRVTALVAAGRLVVGPWYILADELISSGESLIRNLLFGHRLARGLGGGCRVWYGPDAFGHPAGGPRIAAEFGLRGGVVWRGIGASATGSRDLFQWTTRPGRSLLTLHLPPDGYEFGVDLVGEPARLPAAWARVRGVLEPRAVTDQIAVLVGADHHAPSDRLVGLADRLAMLDRSAAFRFSTLDEYFDAAQAAAGHPERARPPATVEGELKRADRHTWALQGVHSTRARLKRHHAAAELGLARMAEPVVALAGLDPGALGLAWRQLLESQFHDTLAGTCADPVAREAAARLTAVRDASRELFRQGLDRLVGHDPDLVREQSADAGPAAVVWNPAPRPRRGVVIVETTWFKEDVLVGPVVGRTPNRGAGAVPFRFTDRLGSTLPCQLLAIQPGFERIDAARHYPDLDRVDRVFVAVDLPPIGGLAAEGFPVRAGPLNPNPPMPQPVTASDSGETLGNGLVTIAVDRRGALTLVDAVRGQTFRGLGRLEDRTDRGDCYTPELGADPSFPRAVGVETLAAGPLVGALAVRWTLPLATGVVTGRTVATIYAGSAAVRIRVELDNHATDHHLSWVAATGVRGAAVAGSAHGAVHRGPGRLDRSWAAEWGRPTDPAHRFVAVASGQRGIALLRPGFFEYQWSANGALATTLLRSVGELSRGDLAARRGHAGWVTSTPEAQELGRHVIELAVVPIDARRLANPVGLVETWEDVFLPLVASWRRQTFPVAAARGLELVGEGLALEAVKPAEDGDGIVLRVVNLGPEATDGVWRSADPILGAALLRADESPGESLACEPGGRSVRFHAPSGAIVSIRLRVKPGPFHR